MKRTEFQRVTPESVGISSIAIDNLLDHLEAGITEMHGIMIMRHDKICAEGWWSPYGPGIPHGLQSLSKTYSATAIGIACGEGLIKLEERLIDIFPEKVPEIIDENLRLLTVRDVLCMGCGMDTLPDVTENWLQNFLAVPVNHQPGTTFQYNSVASTVLTAIVEKKSSEAFFEYLTPRLFDKIGIYADNFFSENMPDGTVYGGGGFYGTTEDNLRLMKLYKDGGIWEGHRILPADYVQLAVSKQNDTATEVIGNPEAADNFLGYGFQIWMCSPEGVYRADGAMGQFAIVCPKQDMIISINETASDAHWAQNTLNEIWTFLETVQNGSLPENNMASEHLKNRMKHLALELPHCRIMRNPQVESMVSGIKYRVLKGRFGLETDIWNPHSGHRYLNGIQEFTLHFKPGACRLEFEQEKEIHQVWIATDGSRRWNCLRLPKQVCSQVYLSGTWVTAQQFLVQARWIETCYENEILFCFDKEFIHIKKKNRVGRFKAMEEMQAVFSPIY